ncbi:hypothetical protein BGZ61DRAFT_172831 [Ilyonectria robusta]|uniref:uncharacterized protein n=1 Tax=Ilyonectria robusta TaxID=1079257 RepID=UPI001E8D67BD|nr:uncharacterized protein BGZ61DRAFT_172831 [Ilyonectria robusta]KAH8659496.1 hypothetical protein BGZ61DRAFT_172831 [Ilyonectria robusta]
MFRPVGEISQNQDEITLETSQRQLPNTVLDDGPDQLKQDNNKERQLLEIFSELKLPYGILNLIWADPYDFLSYRGLWYNKIPTLEKADNDILMLIIWLSKSHATNSFLRKWVNSEEGRLIFDCAMCSIQSIQEREQLVLLVLSMLCFSRMLPSSGIEVPAYDSDLLQFDAVLHKRELSLRVLERMVPMIERVLSCNDYGGTLRDLIWASVHLEDLASAKGPQFSYDYWYSRMCEKDPGHLTALENVQSRMNRD